MTGAIDYATPGPLTDLARVSPSVLERIATEAVEICRVVHNVVIQPTDAEALGVRAERFCENQIRPVDDLKPHEGRSLEHALKLLSFTPSRSRSSSLARPVRDRGEGRLAAQGAARARGTFGASSLGA